MPCPHFDVKIIQRSKRQSAVASAAYQSGERLFSEYDQKQKYYSHKSEIVHTEIMLPPHAPPEYAICEYLALHAGQTFTKEQIYEAVFGVDGTADDTAITQHIKNIRIKLRAAGAPETLLKTVWGVGYQWKSEN